MPREYRVILENGGRTIPADSRSVEKLAVAEHHRDAKRRATAGDAGAMPEGNLAMMPTYVSALYMGGCIDIKVDEKNRARKEAAWPIVM